ncbi:MAG: YjbQ family protein [Candidatus Eisenbacteria bacterium]|nr:YjbQ family protein [Candidatus Eisenbacteria bacterium]
MAATFSVRTPGRTSFVNVTTEVREAVRELGVTNGAVLVYVPHTTAAVTINESADPDVAADIDAALSRIVPHSGPYRHAEGNSDGHIKSSIVGCSETLLVEDGDLVLGTWQGVFFCEFDGPRTRTVHVGVLREG